MADGRETRAVIDTETVRGLLLINGGGAVALLAFLASILNQPSLDELAVAVVRSVFMFQLGLAFALVHNRFRRKCSLQYSRKEVERCMFPVLGKLHEPCICYWSVLFMWASILLFVAAGVVVLVAATKVIG